MKVRLDILALAAVTGVLLVLLAAIAQRGFSQPLSAPTPAPLPTMTPAPSPTGGWWDAVSITPSALPTLPGLPALHLDSLGGGGTRGGEGEVVPFSIVACPQPPVKITRIVTGKVGWWNVSGTAAIPNLEYWKVELSADGKGWTLLYKSNLAVQDGLLIEFNTRTVPKGAYQLRLLAVDRTGNYGEPCTVGITIR